MTLALDPAVDHRSIDAQMAHVNSGPNFPDSHSGDETHAAAAVGDQAPEQVDAAAAPIELALAQVSTPPAPATVQAVTRQDSPVLADPDDQQAAATLQPATNRPSLQLADPLLALSADVLDDLERVRIANENRLRQMTRGEDEVDADGRNDRGFGLDLHNPDVARLAALVDGLTKMEHQAELNLKRILRNHPLGPWVQQARGVGEKQGARLLASIGDPYWNDLHNRPRTVSELWAYCGYHVLRAGHRGDEAHSDHASAAQLPADQSACDTRRRVVSGVQAGSNSDLIAPGAQRVDVGVAAARARGQRANWSATAKMRAYLVSKSIVQTLRKPCVRPEGQDWADHAEGCACGPYRVLYDQGRIKYADSVHQTECKRCGPSGKPALVGSPLSAGHREARALRLVSKEVLKDLWREAKRLHELHDDHAWNGTQRPVVVVDPAPSAAS